MQNKELIRKLVFLSRPNECMLVDEQIIDELIDDYYEGHMDAPEYYRSSSVGYDFDIYELVILIFASIQAIDSLVNIINRVIAAQKAKKGSQQDEKALYETIQKSLRDNGIEEKNIDQYCGELYEELVKKDIASY